MTRTAFFLADKGGVHSFTDATHKGQAQKWPCEYCLPACEHQHLFMILPTLQPELQSLPIPLLPTQTWYGSRRSREACYLLTGVTVAIHWQHHCEQNTVIYLRKNLSNQIISQRANKLPSMPEQKAKSKSHQPARPPSTAASLGNEGGLSGMLNNGTKTYPVLLLISH